MIYNIERMVAINEDEKLDVGPEINFIKVRIENFDLCNLYKSINLPSLGS